MVEKKSDIEKLVHIFANEVAQQTDAIARGDFVTGNKHAKRYIRTFSKLCTFGDAGRDGLLALLSHPRPDVRVTSAAYLLRHRTPEALEVLRSEAARQGLSGFEASQALKRWEDGTWALDPG